MTWYRANRGHRVHADAGSGLDNVYSRRYTVISDGETTLTATSTRQAVETPAQRAALDAVLAEEAPTPEGKPPTYKQQLVAACQRLGLPPSGTTADLEARLLDYAADQAAPGDEHDEPQE